MSIKELPTVRVNFNENEVNRSKIDELCKAYAGMLGCQIDLNNITEMFMYARLLDTYQVSPILFCSYCITAVPKEEYKPYFLLEGSSHTLFTMPISLLTAVEHVYYDMGYVPTAINIEFDPFDFAWKNREEYEAIMNVFIDNNLNDIRYKYYLTIQWR